MPGKKTKQCKVTLEGQEDDTHAATLYVTAKVCVLLLGRLSTHKTPAASSQAGGPTHGGKRWLCSFTSEPGFACRAGATPRVLHTQARWKPAGWGSLW